MQISIDTSKLVTEKGKLDQAKQRKVDELSGICRQKITSDFLCSALGAPHRYPQKETDQLNLAGSVLASTLPGVTEEWVTPFWCADGNGVWDMRPHTAGQIQQVGTESKLRILSLMELNKGLSEQVMLAETAQDVDSIIWPTTDTD